MSQGIKHKDYALEPLDPIKAHWEWLPACDPSSQEVETEDLWEIWLARLLGTGSPR